MYTYIFSYTTYIIIMQSNQPAPAKFVEFLFFFLFSGLVNDKNEQSNWYGYGPDGSHDMRPFRYVVHASSEVNINIAKQSTVLFADAANSRHGKTVASELKICIRYQNGR